MGLDGVELVMALEEEFGIAIPDAAAARMITPRDVIDYIGRRMAAEGGRCLTQVGFYQFRKICMDKLLCPRSAIHPTTPLAALFPSHDVKQRWSVFQKEGGFSRWPKLEHSPLLGRSLLAGFWSAVILCSLWLYSTVQLDWFNSLVLGFFAAALIFIGLKVLLEPAKRNLPQGLKTVGDLINLVMVKNLVEVNGTLQRWDRQRIAQRVKEITIEQLGINEAQYHEDARFVEDFGLG